MDVHGFFYFFRQRLHLQLGLGQLSGKVVDFGLEVRNGVVLIFVGLDLVHQRGYLLLFVLDVDYSA